MQAPPFVSQSLSRPQQGVDRVKQKLSQTRLGHQHEVLHHCHNLAHRLLTFFFAGVMLISVVASFAYWWCWLCVVTVEAFDRLQEVAIRLDCSMLACRVATTEQYNRPAGQ